MFGMMWRNTPDVVKNLLILNLLMFVATMFASSPETDLRITLGLFYFDSPYFEPYQVITHMFMHGNLPHIFFNMFALWMFGSMLERAWGPKRFLIFYFVTGFGAMILHSGVHAFEVYQIFDTVAPLKNGILIFEDGALGFDPAIIDPDSINAGMRDTIRGAYVTPTVGASGAIFGLLIGFAMMFPNMELMLIFLPIPIKAKYFVPFYMAVELYLGVQNFAWDNIAHFAHLGGALFGFLMIMYWRSQKRNPHQP